MHEPLDVIRLSKYVDGELGFDATIEVEEVLQQNDEARDFVLKMVSARSLLQASSGQIESEKVPQDMYRVVFQNSSDWWSSLWELKKIATVLVVSISLVAGYFTGEFQGKQNQEQRVSLVPRIADDYRHVIDKTLENSGVGSSRSWNDSLQRSVTVTPVQTYRGRDRTFYRLYRLQIIEGNNTASLLCLAYRTGKERWQNRAVIYENDIKTI